MQLSTDIAISRSGEHPFLLLDYLDDLADEKDGPFDFSYSCVLPLSKEGRKTLIDLIADKTSIYRDKPQDHMEGKILPRYFRRFTDNPLVLQNTDFYETIAPIALGKLTDSALVLLDTGWDANNHRGTSQVLCYPISRRHPIVKSRNPEFLTQKLTLQKPRGPSMDPVHQNITRENFDYDAL